MLDGAVLGLLCVGEDDDGQGALGVVVIGDLEAEDDAAMSVDEVGAEVIDVEREAVIGGFPVVEDPRAGLMRIPVFFLAGLNWHGQDVAPRGEGAGRILRECAGGIVGFVEVEDRLVADDRLVNVHETPGTVGGVSIRGVAEGDEEHIALVARFEDIGLARDFDAEGSCGHHIEGLVQYVRNGEGTRLVEGVKGRFKSPIGIDGIVLEVRE